METLQTALVGTMSKFKPRTIVGVTAHLPETSLWANRKCLLICAVVAIANMQYGLDSAVLAGLQAMPGFLVVFGHPNPALAGGYGIDVRVSHSQTYLPPASRSLLLLLLMTTGNSAHSSN